MRTLVFRVAIVALALGALGVSSAAAIAPRHTTTLDLRIVEDRYGVAIVTLDHEGEDIEGRFEFTIDNVTSQEREVSLVDASDPYSRLGDCEGDEVASARVPVGGEWRVTRSLYVDPGMRRGLFVICVEGRPLDQFAVLSDDVQGWGLTAYGIQIDDGPKLDVRKEGDGREGAFQFDIENASGTSRAVTLADADDGCHTGDPIAFRYLAAGATWRFARTLYADDRGTHDRYLLCVDGDVALPILVGKG